MLLSKDQLNWQTVSYNHKEKRECKKKIRNERRNVFSIFDLKPNTLYKVNVLNKELKFMLEYLAKSNGFVEPLTFTYDEVPELETEPEVE